MGDVIRIHDSSVDRRPGMEAAAEYLGRPRRRVPGWAVVVLGALALADAWLLWVVTR
ncbi:hypothetical protein [Deferrisoma camini]|uniref:hypothetical protein n=1 Tax=Deferrisoma camini TaxID=1035120 RepID=UPI0004B6C0CB|nr:hypothetical protein [Deferrisoma camini]